MPRPAGILRQAGQVLAVGPGRAAPPRARRGRRRRPARPPRRRSTSRPAHISSSSDRSPRSPEHSDHDVAALRRAPMPAAAPRFTKPATPMAGAGRAASRARVPLLVVRNDRACRATRSRRELQRASCRGRSPRAARRGAPRRAARRAWSARRAGAASSGSATGTIARAAVGERGDDRGGGAQHVDHERGGAGQRRPGTSAASVSATSTRTGQDRAVAERADLQPERVEVDEALGVPLAVDRVGLEGGEVGPVERARRPPAGSR